MYKDKHTKVRCTETDTQKEVCDEEKGEEEKIGRRRIRVWNTHQGRLMCVNVLILCGSSVHEVCFWVGFEALGIKINLGKLCFKAEIT